MCCCAGRSVTGPVAAVGDVLTGTTAGCDLARLTAGDEVTITVDGWCRGRLTVVVTQVRRPLDHSAEIVWLYGVDGGGRARLVLTRRAPPPVIGRAKVHTTL